VALKRHGGSAGRELLLTDLLTAAGSPAADAGVGVANATTAAPRQRQRELPAGKDR